MPQNSQIWNVRGLCAYKGNSLKLRKFDFFTLLNGMLKFDGKSGWNSISLWWFRNNLQIGTIWVRVSLTLIWIYNNWIYSRKFSMQTKAIKLLTILLLYIIVWSVQLTLCGGIVCLGLCVCFGEQEPCFSFLWDFKPRSSLENVVTFFLAVPRQLSRT